MSANRSERDAQAMDVPESDNYWGTGQGPPDLVEQAELEVGSFLDNMFGGADEGDWRAQRSADEELSRPEDRDQS